jgi:hypothetical protein
MKDNIVQIEGIMFILDATGFERQIRRRHANVDVSFPNGTATNNHFK